MIYLCGTAFIFSLVNLANSLMDFGCSSLIASNKSKCNSRNLKKNIEHIEEDTENKTLFLTEMKKEIELLSNKSNDNFKDNFGDLFDVVRYSNPISNEKVFSLEQEILSSLNELKIEINKNNKENILNISNKLKKMFNERDILLK
jgi:hypothetical protein